MHDTQRHWRSGTFVELECNIHHYSHHAHTANFESYSNQHVISAASLFSLQLTLL